MIFYFSGTGNSLEAAKNVAEHNGEKLISIAATMKSSRDCFEYKLQENEMIGFVYPVYAWGPPKMVLEFIDKLKLKNYKNNYIFSIATCGDNIGNTMKVLDKALRKNNMSLSSGFSLRMPNNYIIMGNVDPEEKAKGKLMLASDNLKRINSFIDKRENWAFKNKGGVLSFLKTSVVNPLFVKNAVDTKKFAVIGNCSGCRTCEKVCNYNNIKVDKKPQWGEKCSQCLACIHYCPAQAIQYGKSTERKGRYKNPNVSVNDMYINK